MDQIPNKQKLTTINGQWFEKTFGLVVVVVVVLVVVVCVFVLAIAVAIVVVVVLVVVVLVLGFCVCSHCLTLSHSTTKSFKNFGGFGILPTSQ